MRELMGLLEGTSMVLTMAAVSAHAQPEPNARRGELLQPCCVVETLDASGSSLLLKNTASGERFSVRVPNTGYRPGQLVDMNMSRSLLAITPFPAEQTRKGTVNGQDDWKMQTWVRVSKEGAIDGKTLISSSSTVQGFTGGVEVLLVGNDANILHHTALRTYAVSSAPNGISSRTEYWKETASAPAINSVRAVVIHHSYAPTVLLAASSQWIRNNSQKVYRIFTCTSWSREGGVPRNPSPTATIQCSEWPR